MAQTPQSALPTPTVPWPEIDRLDARSVVGVCPPNTWYAGTKSAIDWMFAAVILIPALPVIAICWAVVRLTSAGPGFYLQKRLGRAGREYSIIKLRTMGHNVEKSTGGAAWSSGKGDMRITPVGAFLRKTHLDELPQLFNVLMGQMSLVGPRPERQEMITKMKLNDLVPGYQHRLLVKPGVTGIAQVQLPADTDITSVKHKIVYDLYYIENFNLWLDLRLMAATAMKTTGMSPQWLRRLFFLPHRDSVAEVFTGNLTIAPQTDEPTPGLATA